MNDRRFRARSDGIARIPCRVCFRPVDLHPDYLMQDLNGRWFMTCPHCVGSFPVRMDDSLHALVARASAERAEAPVEAPVEAPAEAAVATPAEVPVQVRAKR